MAREALTVASALRRAKDALGELPTLVVEGEVSGYRGPNAKSGHCYFDLKDENASMALILWRSTFRKVDFALRDGMEIRVTGSFDVWERSGKMSFVARRVEPAGEGLLRRQVDELARRLQREGLMDESRKRPIPVFCERVGLVTSLSGAVKDDVLRTLARRNPLVEVDICGCAVQGADAPPTIIAALERVAAERPDAILLVRGGGSLEDLMGFNDEAVARAVAACPVPVITGIGHEPDVTICDMVADRRQSTPTAAAESVAPTFAELVERLQVRGQRLATALERIRERGEARTDELRERLPRALTGLVRHRHEVLEALASTRVMREPARIVEERALDLDREEERLGEALPRLVALKGGRLRGMAERLRGAGGRLTAPFAARLGRDGAALAALSPLAVLGRGYAIVRDGAGHVVQRADAVRVGETVEVTLGQGALEAEVRDVTDGDGRRRSHGR